MLVLGGYTAGFHHNQNKPLAKSNPIRASHTVHASRKAVTSYPKRTFHKNIERVRFSNKCGVTTQDSNRVSKIMDRSEKAYLASVTNLKDYTVSATTFFDPPASDGGVEADQILTFNRKPNVPNAKRAN